MGGEDSRLVCGAPRTAFGLCFAEGMNEDGACTVLHSNSSTCMVPASQYLRNSNLQLVSPMPALPVLGYEVNKAPRRDGSYNTQG